MNILKIYFYKESYLLIKTKKIMKKISIIIFLALISCITDKEDIQNQQEKNQIRSDEAFISRNTKGQNIYFSINQPSKHSNNGMLYISIEHPKSTPVNQVQCSLALSENSKVSVPLTTIEKEALDVTFPPGPDNATDWKVFSLDLGRNSRFSSSKVTATIKMPDDTSTNFTRIIIGKPAANNSNLIGAFHADARSLENGKIIKAGTDLLGTKSAKQYMRFPANIFGKGSKEFAQVVEFKEVPFGPETSNADTEMIRTKDVTPGGTTPIKLVKFANTTVNPITVETSEGPILVTITARLSSNAKSNGFITIGEDGSYQSTTTLFPIFTIQQVDKNSRAVNEPIIIDTAITQIPGYPFYLASNGGKWSEGVPEGRLITNSTSNFFYNNGEVNNFIHSNGPGVGVLAACAKASVNNAAAITNH